MGFRIFEFRDCRTQRFNKPKKGEFVYWWTKLNPILFEGDLQGDLRQNTVYNPFIENLKKMIHELGNVEYFELCETNSRVQCSNFLSYWAQGILYSNCAHLLVNNTEEVLKLIRGRFDALSISIYVIRKRSAHRARHGKSEEQTNYYTSFNAYKD